MKKLLLSSLLISLCSMPSLAQEPAQKASQTGLSLTKVNSLFTQRDTDKNGRVSLREAQAAGHSLADFRGYDSDGDGFVTKDEFLFGYSEQLKSRGARLGSELSSEVERIRARRASRREAAAGGAERSGSSARTRASQALSRLQDQRQERRANAATDPVRQRSGSTSSEAARTGPAAGRRLEQRTNSARDLGRLLRDRRSRASQQPSSDPRVEQARQRARDSRTERKGGAIERRGNASQSGSSRRGGTRGPAAGRSGGGRTTGSRTIRSRGN